MFGSFIIVYKILSRPHRTIYCIFLRYFTRFTKNKYFRAEKAVSFIPLQRKEMKCLLFNIFPFSQEMKEYE